MSTTAAETERAPESQQPNVSGSADPPTPRPEIPAPAGSDNPKSLDVLKRLSELYPKEVGKILESQDADTWSSEIHGRLNQKIDEHGWGCLADVAEFVENWQPGGNGQRTGSGNREQLVAIVRASNAFDKLDCLHAAGSKLLEDHATGSGGEPTMPERDCTTLDYLLNSADDVIEDAQGKIAKYVVEFSHMPGPNEKPESNADDIAAEQPSQSTTQPDDTFAATLNLDDIRERVLRAAGLTQAAVLTEASLTNNGPSNCYGDPEDYFNAVAGTVRAANNELDGLLKALSGAPEGGGS